MVISSNLLSGGMETKHLRDFSQESKDQLLSFAEFMEDENLKKALFAQEKSLGTSKLANLMNAASQDPLNSVIVPGTDEETDLTLQCLQYILERKMPMVPFARLGGPEGLKMSRAAFAVMIKFSDLSEDFQVLVDTVNMQATEEEGPGKLKALADLIKSQPQGDIIIRRWESASRMRQWINEKKQSLVIKLEKKVKQELLADKEKAKEEKEKKAKEEEEKKAKDEEEKAKEQEEKGDSKTEESTKDE